MVLFRAILALMLAVSLGLAPLVASAADTRMYADGRGSNAVVHGKISGETALKPAPCHNALASPGAETDQDAPQEEHCGACCLAHCSVALPARLFQSASQGQWAVISKSVAEATLQPPDRLYGLIRPPRT
jgi:hypothetical protein